MIAAQKKISAEINQIMHEAIDELKKQQKPVNVAAVARIAGCSRTTVYDHSDVLERINGLKAQVKPKAKEDSQSHQSRRESKDQLREQRETIQELKRDLHMAMIHLTELEDIRRENRQLKETTERQGRVIKENEREKTEMEKELKILRRAIENSKIIDIGTKSKQTEQGSGEGETDDEIR